MCSAYVQAYETQTTERRTTWHRAISDSSWPLRGLRARSCFVLPAMSAPISVFPKDALKIVPADDAQILLVRGERGGAHRGGAVRGGAAYRGGAVRGGAAYRGGAVVRRGAVVTGG